MKNLEREKKNIAASMTLISHLFMILVIHVTITGIKNKVRTLKNTIKDTRRNEENNNHQLIEAPLRVRLA
jgi:hypothetical protein